MMQWTHYVPIVTTVLAMWFGSIVFGRYRERRSGPHLLWWAIGIMIYGVGTFTEASVTLLGWHTGLFRAWYISGALLGGAPLAQGTVYLLFSRRTANVLATALLLWVAVAAACVIASPINYTLVEAHRLSGQVLSWSWVRLFSPLVNTYAATFLIGGAVVSAIRYRRQPETHHRFVGNVLIAVGAMLPGIGGAATRFGHVEVLYVTEFLGLILIWQGYRWNVRRPQVPQPVATAVPEVVTGG
jgi:hypothetical protein